MSQFEVAPDVWETIGVSDAREISRLECMVGGRSVVEEGSG